MRKNIQWLGAMCLLAAVVLLAGCTKEALLPKASGRPYEEHSLTFLTPMCQDSLNRSARSASRRWSLSI